MPLPAQAAKVAKRIRNAGPRLLFLMDIAVLFLMDIAAESSGDPPSEPPNYRGDRWRHAG
nr:hypothetical protein [Mycobacterium pseudoshottsii]